MEEVASRIYNEALGDLDEFFERNLGLIRHVVKRYRVNGERVGFSADDLFQFGAIGLLKAYRCFNPEFKVKTSTYCIPMIEGEIKRNVRDTSRAGFRSPRAVKDLLRKIIRFQLEEKPHEEIAATLEVEVELVASALTLMRVEAVTSESQIMFVGDREGITLGDMIGNEDDHSHLMVEEFLAILDERERFIILETVNGTSQKDIGKALGVTQAQISRKTSVIRAKAVQYFGLSPDTLPERSGGRTTKGDVKEAMKMIREEKHSLYKIEKVTGCSYSLLRRLNEEYAIEKSMRDAYTPEN